MNYDDITADQNPPNTFWHQGELAEFGNGVELALGTTWYTCRWLTGYRAGESFEVSARQRAEIIEMFPESIPHF